MTPGTTYNPCAQGKMTPADYQRCMEQNAVIQPLPQPDPVGSLSERPFQWPMWAKVAAVAAAGIIIFFIASRIFK